MLATLKKEDLKLAILALLGEDRRTEGRMGSLMDAIEIIQSAGVFRGNWQLSRSSTAGLPPAVIDAVNEAVEIALGRWRIDLPPWGASARKI